MKIRKLVLTCISRLCLTIPPVLQLRCARKTSKTCYVVEEHVAARPPAPTIGRLMATHTENSNGLKKPDKPHSRALRLPRRLRNGRISHYTTQVHHWKCTERNPHNPHQNNREKRLCRHPNSNTRRTRRRDQFRVVLVRKAVPVAAN